MDDGIASILSAVCATAILVWPRKSSESPIAGGAGKPQMSTLVVDPRVSVDAVNARDARVDWIGWASPQAARRLVLERRVVADRWLVYR